MKYAGFECTIIPRTAGDGVGVKRKTHWCMLVGFFTIELKSIVKVRIAPAERPDLYFLFQRFTIDKRG